jgi:hypothetical protein
MGGSDTAQPAASNSGAAAAADGTIDGEPIPVFALLHGVDLGLGKEALGTAMILNEDLEDVYVSLDAGSTLSQLGAAVAGYNSLLLAPIQANISAAVNNGNITAQQATQLSDYVNGKVQQEINDSKYRDSDNWFGDALVQKIMGNSDATAAITQFMGMTDDDLTAEFQAGKSLEAVAKEKGFTDDQLIAKLKEIPVASDLFWGPPVAVVSQDQSQPTVTDSTYSD